MSSPFVREFEEQLRYTKDLLDRRMTSSTSTATPMKHDFTRQVEEVQVPKDDINALILDYLTMAGYSNAAKKFSKEARLKPQQDHASIVARQQIQRSIHQGNVQTAIEALNDLDPEILDTDESLHFALLRLQLVELIRTCHAAPGGDIQPALDFATEQLGPRAPTNEKFMRDLEETMSLLVFKHDTLDPSIAVLLKPDLRRDVADKVNKAILDRQVWRRDAAIRDLVQMRAWSEDAVRKETTKKDIPARIDLNLDGDEHLSEDVVMT
ncbi:uncharacterized protein PG986_005889 [Apiospora aurea]|uniref:CTLH domain-containing protein n=1 Tax=Apiospora aurea TaxID=335848 RepID=A0ABR1QJN6_9PEZI